jgi:solute carrier family 4 (sodium bicarbonate transporter), member 10
MDGIMTGDCFGSPYASPIFQMSFILFFGTFLISTVLKDFKNRLFFPSKVRQVVSDFSVIIAIFSMTILDYVANIPTPKLDVPSEFKPTLESRGWLIMPYHEKNPFWSCILAGVPAVLGTILIFMDQQITAVIVNRKENKLKKGCGYHLDLFVLAILIQICTFLGIPWFVAATVLSINHVNSLKVESETAAPGEKPQFLGVREQRATHIMIFLTIGCSVKLTPLLSHIPMPGERERVESFCERQFTTFFCSFVWRFPLHGRGLAERTPVLRSTAHHADARQVSARLHVPTTGNSVEFVVLPRQLMKP